MAKGEWCKDEMVCGPTTHVVIEEDCRMCEGSGIECYRIRATCKPCGGSGKLYKVYHDGSMFDGRDSRGKTRRWTCDEHGGPLPFQYPPWRKCCDKIRLVLVSA